MKKQKDLKAVFEFIADFLREDDDISPVKASPAKETISEIAPEPVGEDPKVDSKVEHALAIMKRIDDMDKAKANAHNMIKFNDDLKTSLQRQLNDLRHEHAMKVSEDTIAEEEALNPQAPIIEAPVEMIKEEISVEIKPGIIDEDKAGFHKTIHMTRPTILKKKGKK